MKKSYIPPGIFLDLVSTVFTVKLVTNHKINTHKLLHYGEQITNKLHIMGGVFGQEAKSTFLQITKDLGLIHFNQ